MMGPAALSPSVAAGAALGAALAATIWLWAACGTAVFFETIRMGFMPCFG
jgi:hypothetical protein